MEKIEKIVGKFAHGFYEGIYSQGTSHYREDGWYRDENEIFAVIDAYSEPYAPKFPQIIQEGLSLGEITARTIEKACAEAKIVTARGILAYANNAVRKVKSGVPKEISNLAGASFATAQIEIDTTHIITGGDVFAIIERKGNITMTENQVKNHDTVMNNEIEILMKKVAQDWNINLETASEEMVNKVRSEMWNRFVPILREARGKAINREYASLNGYRRLEWMWKEYSFPSKKIKRVILFSDGFVDWEFLKNVEPQKLSIFLLELYKSSGLEGILYFTRSAEATRAHRNYIKQAEATAIAIKFD